MKKLLTLACVLLTLCAAVFAGCAAPGKTIHVYNWGDYIDTALIDAFEEETGIQVVYSTFASNEEMFAKLSAGSSDYDVLVPSDYMIERLISNSMLAELDYANLPNAANVIPSLKNLAYDPQGKYSVPYMWGTVGIIYNREMVDGEITSWASLWDEKYAKQILMYDSARDSIAVAQRYLGFDLNTRDEAELEQVYDALAEQKPLVLSYALDDCRDKMIAGEAALAVVYSGDASLIIAEGAEAGKDLAYCIPTEGSNIFVDAMCIPANSKNKALAEQFINYMCRQDVAVANTNYIAYSPPIQGVYDLVDEELRAVSSFYPTEEEIARCAVFRDLGDFNRTYEQLWQRVKMQ